MKTFTRQEIEGKLKDIIVDQLGVDRSAIRGITILSEDLGADSIDEIEIVMAMEREFYIDIPDDDIFNIFNMKSITVDDMCEYIEQKVGKIKK